MVRFGLIIALVLTSLPVVPVAAADDPCADLASQVASQEQQLDQARTDALPRLQQASQSAAVVLPDLLVAAQLGSDPALSLQLAQSYGALAAQAGVEMTMFANDADALATADFVGQLARHAQDWQSRLAGLGPFVGDSGNLQALNSALQSLSQVEAQAQVSLALRNDLAKQLAACQQQSPNNPSGAVLGCGLTYFGLDRAGPRLKSAMSGLPAGAKPGDQWDYASTYPVQEGGSVAAVDTYRCTTDGATKVGRTAIQTFPDGSTAEWGERDYTGTLWPQTIARGATWQWHAIQYSGGDEETWNVTVNDAGREVITLAEGQFEAIDLHYEEDIQQTDGDTQHISWDEWYARPLVPAA